MVDNRYATALVIGSVLSLLATVYLSVAVGTQHWYQYSNPPVKRQSINATELKERFNNGDFDEKTYSEPMFYLNGTLGLWWRCIMVPGESHWFKEPGITVFVQGFCHWCLIMNDPSNHILEGDDEIRSDPWRDFLQMFSSKGSEGQGSAIALIELYIIIMYNIVNDSKSAVFALFRPDDGDPLSELHTSSAVHAKVQTPQRPQQRRRSAENMSVLFSSILDTALCTATKCRIYE